MVRNKRFTLVELLVVISIIAVLMSMLLPALGKAKGASLSIVCKNNFRQIGIAFGCYGNDYNGYYPKYMYGLYAPAWCSPNGPLAPSYLSGDTVYGGNATVGWRGACPAAELMWEYAMNWYIGVNHVQQNVVANPSVSFVVTDNCTDVAVAPSSAEQLARYRHGMGITNYLYCDGHADSLNYKSNPWGNAALWKSW